MNLESGEYEQMEGLTASSFSLSREADVLLGAHRGQAANQMRRAGPSTVRAESAHSSSRLGMSASAHRHSSSSPAIAAWPPPGLPVTSRTLPVAVCISNL